MLGDGRQRRRPISLGTSRMIHYHGLPITPGSSAIRAVKAGHAFVSYAHRQQLDIAVSHCQSFALDNGAFSAWKSGTPVTDWLPFFEWADEVSRVPNCDFVVIPDVIDGDLNAQSALIGRFLQHFGHRGMSIGAPVFHLHEPIAHAKYLSRAWQRVCIGSSGDYSTVGTPEWWERMYEVVGAMCDEFGRPNCKIHGLRMLNPNVFCRLPLASADSTNIGRNIGIDKNWRGTYIPRSKDTRALIMRERIEDTNSVPVLDIRYIGNRHPRFDQILSQFMEFDGEVEL